MNKEKSAALEAAIKHIEKSFGEGSIMRFGQKQDLSVEVIPTGSLGLDIALGVGGFPYGRIIEIYGPESSGKTTLALHAIAEAQKKGGVCAIVDTEHAFDPTYATKIGVKIDSNHLIMSQPDTAEQALEIIDTLVRSQAINLIVLDSVAALVPKAELEGDMGDSHMGLQARLMSQALRKLTGAVSKSNCVIIFINQIRQKIGVMFGNPETTTGGNALKFYSSIRLDIRRVAALKKGEDTYGNQTRVKVVKNKVAPPFKTVDFEVIYGQGISKVSEIITLGVKFDLIKKSGSWYSIDNNKIGQGQDSVKKYFEENPKVAQDIEDKIKQYALKNGVDLSIVSTDEESLPGEDAE
jgi:recombination protein RecA